MRLCICFLASCISYSVSYRSISIAYFSACNFLILIVRVATIYWALGCVPASALDALKCFFFFEHSVHEKYEKHMEMKFKPWSFSMVSFTLKAALSPLYHYAKKLHFTETQKLQMEWLTKHSPVATCPSQSRPLESFSPPWSYLKTAKRLFRQIYQTSLPISVSLEIKNQPAGQGSKIK